MVAVERRDINIGESQIDESLKYAYRRFSLSEKSFASSQEDTLIQARNILHESNQESEFCLSPEDTILFFSFVDDWNVHGNSSDYPLTPLLEEIGIYVPESSPFERDNSFLTPILEESRQIDSKRKADPWEFYSESLSKNLTHDFFEDWSSDSFLVEARESFEITIENEQPYYVLVTDLNSDEFSEHFYSLGYVTFYDEYGLITLPKDASESTIVHEYIHTQWNDLLYGTENALYRGLEEAVVEDHTFEPFEYQSQRNVLHNMMDSIPQFLESVKHAGSPSQGRDALLTQIVAVYGLSGVNAVSRLSPLERNYLSHSYSSQQCDIFLPPTDVQEMLVSATIPQV